MKQKVKKIPLALEFATNMLGVINPEVKRKLERVIKRPNQKTWEDAYSLIIDDSGKVTTLWQAVIKIDWNCPVSKPLDQPWSYIPSSETIIKAIQLAVFKNNKNRLN
ncbi:MAG: hypothetical protein BWY47_01541 [Bacteroidetes bacterium ADurb.Bin302]|jgi:hypothetical protein|nr:MAG: hypothetical protein BWY47_01541 [Bacteroidetes bacterium ADurb.Bin302]